MKVKRHILLYILCGLWNVTVCWPGVLLIRLFWGENLRWERNPDTKAGDGPSLWCDLKKGSWPTRSWYRQKTKNPTTGKKKPHQLPEYLWERFGQWWTWGGTTFGHGGFYGPGHADPNGWTTTQEHEHDHVETFEAATLRAFWVGAYHAALLIALGHPWWALSMFLFDLWAGYIWVGANNVTAWLRGEDPYRGAEHEERAYDDATLFGQKQEP